MKPAFVLTALFVASFLAVVAGYYNAAYGLSLYPLKVVVRELPIFRTAVLLTFLCPAILLVSFWLSRGNEGTYQGSVLGWSVIAPMPIVMLLLPGEQSKPENTSLNMYALLFLVCASQAIAARALRGWFWKKGVPT